MSLVEAAVGAGFDERLGRDARRADPRAGRRAPALHPSAPRIRGRRTPDPGRRRSLHARLAEIVPTAEERARHLALATVEPDDEIAAILEEAARTAHARGAPAAAAELAEQALRLTPATSPDDALRRVLVAADLHTAPATATEQSHLLEQGAQAAAPGNERATVLARLAGVAGTPADGRGALPGSARGGRGDDALQATIHLRLAALMRFSDGFERGIEHSRLAVRAAARVDDVALRCRALAAYGLMQFEAGRGDTRRGDGGGALARAALPEWPLDDGPTSVLGHQLWWSADVERARVLFEEVRAP